jgi:hypothetical protein
MEMWQLRINTPVAEHPFDVLIESIPLCSVNLFNPSTQQKTYIILLKATYFDFRKSSSGLS